MGWSIGWCPNWNRDIGYGVPAYCDFPGCNEEIDRGLSYKCLNEDDFECTLFFCENHRIACEDCESCYLVAKPNEHPEWINWKLTDESWKQWREENPEEVEKLKKFLTP